MNTFYILILGFLGVTSCTDILMITPIGLKSHLTVFEYVAKGLSEKGYKITVFTSYPISNEEIPNVKEYKFAQQEMPQAKGNMQELFKPQKSSVLSFPKYREMFYSGCENMFAHPEIKALIEEVTVKGPKYKLAFVNGVFCECALPLARIAAKNIILISTQPLTHWIANNYNIPASLSTVPNIFTDFVTPMTFSERFHNTWSGYFIDSFYRFVLVRNLQEICNKYLPDDTPKIEEVIKSVSLIFCNSDPISGIPRPSMPFIVDIGGIHLQETKPLPKEFEEYIRSSGTEGVIMFGLGSYVQSQYLPMEIRDAFINAFSKLKQTVIWKFEADIEGLPTNIKMVKWMPQQDLLARPEVRLFITHSGRFSLQEASYHGVPVIGIPIYGDQHHNIRLAKSYGYAEEISLLNITADGVYALIMKMLNEKKYSEKAKKASVIMRDSLTTPKERAVYWTEYVIRHNGAYHLKNRGALEQGFVQFLLLDVLGFMTLIVIVVISISIIIMKYIWKYVSRKFHNQQKEKIK